MSHLEMEQKLRYSGIDEAALQSFSRSTPQAPQRPGTFRGNHFFDLGDTLIWQTGADGDKCGENTWFTPAKKDGDTAQKMGTCATTGLDWYLVTLVD